MISKEEVKHIANLARLSLTAEEVTKFQKELSLILDYINKLKEVDISNAQPNIHSVQAKNVMREDTVRKEDLEVRKKLIEMAPEKKGDYVKVKHVF